ncbi:pancreatic triacylglycerol lipase-like [Eriocheir sinensis]|uniref:pancreatic triacylglycerol lipase-like n=1 Tax=Eriocheir sinensis TaxID=95602 RepID=UPI0021C770FF|nr:pancreatic triacylglycerol lipase-like [Eriocheir sinensis]
MLLSVLVAVQVVAGARADDVNFLLWTRSNPGDLQFHTLLLGDADNLAAAPLTPSDPTALLIHGYTSSGFTGWSRTAKTELLSYSPYNVISVDWESLAEGPWYPGAVQNTQVVGERTARLLEWLQEEAGLDTTLVQVTGHSLGAHVSGAIGQHLQGFRLQYITGKCGLVNTFVRR